MIDLLVSNEKMDLSIPTNLHREISLTKHLLSDGDLTKKLMKQIFRTKLADNFGIIRGRCITGEGETRPLSVCSGPQLGGYYMKLLEAEKKFLRREERRKKREEI